MELKKNPEANLENKRGMLFQVGLVAALAIVLVAFEWSVYEGDGMDLGNLNMDNEEEELIPITQQEIKPPPPPPPQPTQIEIVEDDVEVEDTEIEDTEMTEDMEIEQIEQPDEVIDEPEIFTIVEQFPAFPGGEEKLFKYLSNNIKYPAMAKDAGISGIVYVKFVVRENGKISDVTIAKGIGGGCDDEAKRVVKGMPKWNPGKQRGKPVAVYFNLPIRFTLK